MKVAIAAAGEKLESPFAHHFSSATYFIIINTAEKTWNAYPNPAWEVDYNKGGRAAHFLVDQGVKTVISGDFGPCAMEVLAQAGIQMFWAGTTVKEVSNRYWQGELEQVTHLDEIVPDPAWFSLAQGPVFPHYSG